MTARNILFATEPTVPLYSVADSGFTHLILGSVHIEQNPAMKVFRILNGPVSDISPLFRASDFSAWLDPLDAGTFPEGLRQASEQAFFFAEQPPLSDDLTVTVNAPGTSWTLTDNVSGNVYPMQMDPNGTFLSFNGAPLTTISNDPNAIASYEKSLNTKTFPAALQQAAGLPGDNSDYTVTKVAPQITGQPQWLITNTTNDFVWFVAMGSQEDPNAMVVRNYQDFWSPNLTTFMASLDPVTSAGIPIIVSLGGATDFQTWSVMGQYTQQSLVVIAELLDFLGPQSGVDFDYEQDGAASDITAMTQFTQGLQAALPGTQVTICPYGMTIDTLLQVWTNVGLDAIAWANCMNYAPTNEPASNASTFVKAIANNFGMQSAADAAPYVVIGFTANYTNGDGQKVYLTPEQLTETNKIKGCQSQVWLVTRPAGERLEFQAVSDSAIVSGLIAILMRIYSGRPARDIIATPPDFIGALGLDQHLSPTRSNGLHAMLRAIRAAAAASLAH